MAPVQLTAVAPPAKPASSTKGGAAEPPALIEIGPGTLVGPAHEPEAHVSPVAQTSPQAPQFAPSLVGSTQTPPHRIAGDAQAASTSMPFTSACRVTLVKAMTTRPAAFAWAVNSRTTV